jgi:hypothetical protein
VKNGDGKKSGLMVDSYIQHLGLVAPKGPQRFILITHR